MKGNPAPQKLASPSCQATSSNRTRFYVSYRRNAFVPMKLPKYALPKVGVVSSPRLAWPRPEPALTRGAGGLLRRYWLAPGQHGQERGWPCLLQLLPPPLLQQHPCPASSPRRACAALRRPVCLSPGLLHTRCVGTNVTYRQPPRLVSASISCWHRPHPPYSPTQGAGDAHVALLLAAGVLRGGGSFCFINFCFPIAWDGAWHIVGTQFL